MTDFIRPSFKYANRLLIICSGQQLFFQPYSSIKPIYVYPSRINLQNIWITNTQYHFCGFVPESYNLNQGRFNLGGGKYPANKAELAILANFYKNAYTSGCYYRPNCFFRTF